MIHEYEICTRIREGKNHSEDLEVDEGIILHYM